MDSDLTTLVALTAMVMVVPGPSVVFAATQRVQGGAAVGVCGVLGLETGLLVHVAACTLGVSAVVAASPSALLALKVAGAGYLAVLGSRQLLAARHPDAGMPSATPGAVDAVVAGARSRRARAFRDGFLVDLLNPKTVVFVLALLPQFLGDEHGPWRPVLAGGVVVALGLAADLTWMLLAGWLCGHRRTPAERRWAGAATGTALIGFACALALH